MKKFIKITLLSIVAILTFIAAFFVFALYEERHANDPVYNTEEIQKKDTKEKEEKKRVPVFVPVIIP